MSVLLKVVGCSPAWPTLAGPSPATSSTGPRLLLDCGPGVLARLRDAEKLAGRRRDRDHPLAPRPLGRPGGPGSGARCSGRRYQDAAAVGAAGRSTRCSRVGGRLGRRGCSTNVHLHEYPDDEPFTAAGFASAAPCPPLQLLTFGLRLPDGTVLATPATPGRATARRDRPRRRPFICEATLGAANPEGDPRGHLLGDEALEAYGRRERSGC